MIINSFRGEYYFLSNFYPSPVTIGEIRYPTGEHAFQAMKDPSPGFRTRVANVATPRDAKGLGRQANLRGDWEQVKMGIMLIVVCQKFAQNPDLAAKLVATKGELIEGNTWHDQTWGDCTCPEHIDIRGDNGLGVVLMTVRAILE